MSLPLEWGRVQMANQTQGPRASNFRGVEMSKAISLRIFVTVALSIVIIGAPQSALAQRGGHGGGGFHGGGGGFHSGGGAFRGGNSFHSGASSGGFRHGGNFGNFH